MRVMDLISSAPEDPVPRSGADRSATMVARVLSVSKDGTRVTVALFGSDPITLPATASVWTGISTCHVLMDPWTGRPAHVIGPATKPADELSPPLTPPPNRPVLRSRTGRVALPEVLRTYWAGKGWQVWNTARYGGATDLYQGEATTGGALRGLAEYGQQIVALGATRVVRAVLTVTGNGAVPGRWTLTLQCADPAETGPAASGPTVSGTVEGTRTTELDITALGPGLLSGRGIATVGAAYGAVSGRGQSMSISLDYEVSA